MAWGSVAAPTLLGRLESAWPVLATWFERASCNAGRSCSSTQVSTSLFAYAGTTAHRVLRLCKALQYFQSCITQTACYRPLHNAAGDGIAPGPADMKMILPRQRLFIGDRVCDGLEQHANMILLATYSWRKVAALEPQHVSESCLTRTRLGLFTYSSSTPTIGFIPEHVGV